MIFFTSCLWIITVDNFIVKQSLVCILCILNKYIRMHPFFENIAVPGLSGWVWDGKGVVYTMCIKIYFKGIHLCFLGLYEMCWINNSFKRLSNITFITCTKYILSLINFFFRWANLSLTDNITNIVTIELYGGNKYRILKIQIYWQRNQYMYF